MVDHLDADDTGLSASRVMDVDGRHHRDEAEKPRDNLARDQEEKRMLRNLRMTEVAIVNRDVGETSAVGTYGTVSKRKHSAWTVCR
jgi:hypothetical protein